MRWGAAGTSNQLQGCVEAVPVVLSARDGDGSHLVSPRHRKPTSKSGSRPPSSRSLSGASSAISDHPPPPRLQLPVTSLANAEVTDDRVESGLVLSGRVVPGLDNSPETLPLSARGNNYNDEYFTLPFATDPPERPTKKQPTPRGLQRSDSELDLIINELREKIALQQRREETKKAAAAALAQAQLDEATCAPRKHLKNPLERVNTMSNSSSTHQLRRQPSAGQVNRLVTEGTASMVAPAIISSSTSRSSLLTTATSQAALLDSKTRLVDGPNRFAPAARDGCVDSCDGFRITSYPGTGETPNPHHVSSTSLGLPQHPPATTSTRTPSNATTNGNGAKGTSGSRLLGRSSSTSEVTVGKKLGRKAKTLVDFDDHYDQLDDDDVEIGNNGSRSPVGPWVVDYFEASKGTTDHGTLSTCRSSSSLSSQASSSSGLLEFRVCDDGEMSPRSRLLWLSDYSTDESWGATSIPAMVEMLRPGRGSDVGSRPKSASKVARKRSLGSSSNAPTKPRARSAHTSSRPSSGNSCHANNASRGVSNRSGNKLVAQRPGTASTATQRPRTHTPHSTAKADNRIHVEL